MKPAVMMLLILFFMGCSTQESVPETRSEVSAIEAPSPTQTVNEIVNEPVSSINFELASNLDTQLILGLWLHLDKEKARFAGMLESPLSEPDRLTIQKFIGMLEEQQKATWQTLFEPEKAEK